MVDPDFGAPSSDLELGSDEAAVNHITLSGNPRILWRFGGSSSPRSASSRKSKRRPSVVIVDNTPVFRAGLGAILAASGIRNVLSYPSLSEFNLTDRRKWTDGGDHAVMLIGVKDQWDDDFSWAVELIDSGFRVVILCESCRPQALLAALETGVVGCLLKSDIEPGKVASTLDLICLGGVVISHDLVRFRIALSGHLIIPAGNETSASLVSQLSKRELRILDLLIQGASNNEIARKLDIAEATLEVRIIFLLRKIRVNNRTQVAMWATQHLSGRFETC